jgi:hypothetical protein
MTWLRKRKDGGTGGGTADGGQDATLDPAVVQHLREFANQGRMRRMLLGLMAAHISGAEANRLLSQVGSRGGWRFWGFSKWPIWSTFGRSVPDGDSGRAALGGWTRAVVRRLREFANQGRMRRMHCSGSWPRTSAAPRPTGCCRRWGGSRGRAGGGLGLFKKADLVHVRSFCP